MVSSVIDLLLRTLFNIEAATVVTLLVESYPFVFAVYWAEWDRNRSTPRTLLKIIPYIKNCVPTTQFFPLLLRGEL